MNISPGHKTYQNFLAPYLKCMAKWNWLLGLFSFNLPFLTVSSLCSFFPSIIICTPLPTLLFSLITFHTHPIHFITTSLTLLHHFLPFIYFIFSVFSSDYIIPLLPILSFSSPNHSLPLFSYQCLTQPFPPRPVPLPFAFISYFLSSQIWLGQKKDVLIPCHR